MRSNSKTLPILKRLQNLLGAGIYVLMTGILLEALTLIVRRWVSFPISIGDKTRTILTVSCMILCVSGMIWFNRSLNLVKVHLAGGENKIVTHGPFEYVRHPLYATMLLSLPPLMILWYADLIFFLPWIVMIAIAHGLVRREERGLIRTFREDYLRYKRYVPALLPYKGAGGRRYRESRNLPDG